MIGKLVLALELGASPQDLALTGDTDPTSNEVVREGAFAVTGNPLNS